MSHQDKDHLAISQKHIFSKDERRYIRAYAHALIAVAQELRKLNQHKAQNKQTDLQEVEL